MTDPDYRAMCAELADALAEWRLGGGPPEDTADADLIERARALLAQPVAEGLTEIALQMLGTIESMGLIIPEITDTIRKALEQGRRPTPQPVAVSERLPGPEDCDEQGRCWMFGYVEGDWRLISATNSGIPKLKYCFSHWLPANALPTPEAKP